MSTQITTAMRKAYSDSVIELVQQKGSRLRNTIMTKTVTQADELYFDRVGVAAVTALTSRHQATPRSDIPHTRRRVTSTPYATSDLIDKADKVRTLGDWEGPYSRAIAYALGRQMDDIIIAALRGNAYGGVDGGTAVPLPSTQKVAVGSTGLTVDKLLAALQIFNANDVESDEQKWCIIGAEQVTNLLDETEVKSADYNTVKAIAMGKVESFMGFNFIMSNRLALSSTTRYVLAYTESAAGLALLGDIESQIDILPEHNYSVQVYGRMDVGATRVEEEKVVEIACAE